MIDAVLLYFWPKKFAAFHAAAAAHSRSRSCYPTIPHLRRTDEIRESDIGTGAGLFEVVKIGDEYWTFVVDCKDPKACTVLLRGASKEILNEVSDPCVSLGRVLTCLRSLRERHARSCAHTC